MTQQCSKTGQPDIPRRPDLLIKRWRWRDERDGNEPRTEPANKDDCSRTFKDVHDQHDQCGPLAQNAQRVRGSN
jgi:hypothetical protein